MSEAVIVEETTEASNLCERCSRLDFHGWFQIGRAKRDAKRSEIKLRNLGKLVDIRENIECAFCRMIVFIADLYFKKNSDLIMEDFVRCWITPIDVRSIEAKRTPQLIRRLQVHFYEGVSMISPVEIQMLDDGIDGDQLDLWMEEQTKQGRVPDVEALKVWQPFGGALATCGGLLASQDLDISLVSKWLDTCMKDHDGTCTILRPDRGDRPSRTLIKGGFELGTDLRVIDVQAMKICNAPVGLDYVALSYLWGGVSMLKTTRENIARLSQNGGIREDEIPRTVRDAIHFCRRIGRQYLWVDAFCIIQDDDDDKASQISRMQAIYRFADFTIVAASGSDSNAGLPGINSRRSVVQHIEKIQGLRLVTTLPSWQNILENTIWNTRAWTFQERLLSRRLVVFTDHQMHFRCEGGEFCEDTRVDRKKPEAPPGYRFIDHTAGSLLRPSFGSQGYFIYQDLVAQYSQKQLSFPADVLSGFSGIINALKPFGDVDQYWRCGLPMKKNMLVKSLLWMPTYKMPNELRTLGTWQAEFERREGQYRVTHDNDRREEKPVVWCSFPSWSWIGWMGDIDYLNYPGPIGDDCEVAFSDRYSPDHNLLHIKARVLTFNVRCGYDIAMTRLAICTIEDSDGEVISDFVHNVGFMKFEEVKRFDFLLLVTMAPDVEGVVVRHRQWKPISRYVPMSEAMHPPRQAHKGPFMNAMMISRSPENPEQPAEREALAYIPMKYWEAEGVKRESVVLR